jgi:hypothetical protein
VAFAAGLRIVQRTQSITKLLHFVEGRLVGLVRGIIHHAIGFVVETRWGVWNGDGSRNQSKA